MKRSVLIASILLAVTFSAGYTDGELEKFRENYNSQSSEVPGFVGSIVDGERINIRINGSEDTEKIGAVMNGVKIKEIDNNTVENPSLKVYAERDALETIKSSTNKYGQLRKEMDQSDISYETTNLVSGIKMTVANTLAGIGDMLGLF